MRDWREYVRGHLGSLSLSAPETSEVVEELASHLEERYAALLAAGLPEEKVFERTSSQVQNWINLRREILSAKREGKMNERTGQVWLPSLVTLFSSFLVLTLLLWVGLQPVIWLPGAAKSAGLHIPWLLVLPLIGAVGAYMSRRAQGTGLRVYVAGAFPALAIAVIFLTIFSFAFVVGANDLPDLKPTSMVAMTISWVVLPCLVLALGVVLQGLFKTRTAPR